MGHSDSLNIQRGAAMAGKSRFVGVRFEPEQQRKLIMLSVVAGEPGNMSAALRWLVDRAPAEKIMRESAGVSVLAGGQQREAVHGG